MTTADINVGRTYYNRRKGQSSRRVVSIRWDGLSADWRVSYVQVTGPGAGQEGSQWLWQFADWAGGEGRR